MRSVLVYSKRFSSRNANWNHGVTTQVDILHFSKTSENHLRWTPLAHVWAYSLFLRSTHLATNIVCVSPYSMRRRAVIREKQRGPACTLLALDPVAGCTFGIAAVEPVSLIKHH